MQIKIRAWDSINKKMLSWEDLLSGREFRPKMRNPEAFGLELMLWTGLKDKDGKEIYEGDVIECWSEGVKAIGEVKRRINGWWFIYPAWQNSIMWGLCPNDKGETTVKILGNIYENPEMVEDE